jgi:uncharacterized protein (TIGR02271 family)
MTPRNKINEPLQESGRVVGLFRDQFQAERAIRDLKSGGFSDNQIGVLMQDPEAGRRLAEDTGTKAGEGAKAGALSGGVVGGVLGLLAGVGALAIPGIGPIIAGGALASTLAGAGIGAAAGGLLGALMGMGIPEDEARYYESGLKEGGILLTVEAGARRSEAERILSDAGAEFGRGRTEVAGDRSAFVGEDRSRLELREEELAIEKDVVQKGEVRVRKEVVSEERTIDVPVTREEVVIERTPVAGRSADAGVGTNEEIRIPVSEEQVRVEKTPVVKEEVKVNKRRVQDTERVRDTVRREEARVEEVGDAEARTEGELVAEPWRGNERRYQSSKNYNGPERRLARI